MPTANTASSFGPATSFQYKHVGVNLELTPEGERERRHHARAHDGRVQHARRQAGRRGQPPDSDVITRNITGTLRLRDGETTLLGGLLTNQESTTRAGALGVEKIPFLNRIFGSNTKNNDDQEVLISITPHVVRAPKITEDDLSPLGVGTDELVKVQGSRPSLFGEPEAEPKPPEGVVTPPNGKPAPAPPATAPNPSPLTPLPIPPNPVPPEGAPQVETARA